MSPALLRTVAAWQALDCIRARQHRPAPGSLARMVGLAPEQEAALLEQLSQAGQIQRRRGRWVVKEVLTVDTRVNWDNNWLLKRHWANVALERMSQGPEAEGVFSYNLFAISNADLASIRELHIEYFERVRAIISACKCSERVVLINQQLVPLGPEA